MFHCTSNTCIRKNSGTYLFDEVTTDEQTTSKLVVQESIVDVILRMWVLNSCNSCGLTVPASTLHNLLVTALYIS